MVVATLEWERVGGRFFRLCDGFVLNWDVKGSESEIRMAPGGGVMAVWDRADVVRRNVTTSRPEVRLYDGAGEMIGLIPVDSQVIDVQIDAEERLSVMTRSGLVKRYVDFSGEFSQLSIGSTISGLRAHDEGFIIKTNEGFAFVDNDLRSRRESFDGISSCTGWDVIPTVKDAGQSLSIVACNSQGVWLLSGTRQKLVLSTPHLQPKVSPDGLAVLLYGPDKYLSVHPSDFHDSKFYNNLEGTPFWVGNDAILINGTDNVELLDVTSGNHGPIDIDGDEILAMFSEDDGLRILGSTHDFFQSVPSETVDALKVGSAAPAEVLVSAVDLLDEKSPRADQNLKLLGSNLSSAVDDCITSALAELDTKYQKKLLQAAAFGKSALPLYNSSRFTDACDSLRTINTLRDFHILVTMAEIDKLGMQRIVDRLSRRHKWGMAIAVANLFHLRSDLVWLEWAGSKVSSDISDEALESLLETKLEQVRGFLWGELALKAIEEGRSHLAQKLLSREPIPEKRVRIMLDMNDYSGALNQAVASGNPNLAYHVLSLLRKHLTIPQLLRAIGDNPNSERLFMKLLSNEPKALLDFLYQMDMRREALAVEFSAAVSDPQVTTLKSLELRYRQLKSLNFESKMANRYAALLECQEGLERDYDGTSFMGTSAAETVSKLLKISQTSRASKVRSLLGISEPHWWYIRLRALTDRRDWDGIRALSKEARKPPIGFLPFFDACADAGNLEEAAQYIESCSEATAEQKVSMYIRCGYKQRANELATQVPSLMDSLRFR